MTQPARRGITLLEVLLTMSVAVVIAGLSASAMRLYAREMNVRDLEIRRTHLAASLMQMIESDFHSVARTTPPPVDALETFLLSAIESSAVDTMAADSTDMSAAGIDSELPPGIAAVDGMDSESAMTDQDTGTADLVGGLAGSLILQTPGLVGDSTTVQIDVSRLPRIEEYSPMMPDASGRLMDVPSDLKTVTYTLQSPGGPIADAAASMIGSTTGAVGGTVGTASVGGNPGGLVRRILDRAAMREALSGFGLSSLMNTGQLIAPEVSGLSFQYWDGINWLPNWNSDDMGALPAAIRVDMTLVNVLADGSSMPDTASPPVTYTHIIQLPLAPFGVDAEGEVIDSELPPESGDSASGMSGGGMSGGGMAGAGSGGGAGL